MGAEMAITHDQAQGLGYKGTPVPMAVAVVWAVGHRLFTRRQFYFVRGTMHFKPAEVGCQHRQILPSRVPPVLSISQFAVMM